MSENPLEFHEHREHAMHAAEANDPLITRVSITIAVLAVVTAIIGSIESVETAGAVLESNKATLQQALASDQWAYYQAKGIKKRLDEMAAAAGGPNSAKAAEKAKEEGERKAKDEADRKPRRRLKKPSRQARSKRKSARKPRRWRPNVMSRASCPTRMRPGIPSSPWRPHCCRFRLLFPQWRSSPAAPGLGMPLCCLERSASSPHARRLSAEFGSRSS